ncbi:MAG: polysaccharide biosynthesis/export family protein [Vicinamibacterales bacterium]
MRIRLLMLAVPLLTGLSGAAHAQSAGAPPTPRSAPAQLQLTTPATGERYVIGPQDNLSITVVGEEELTKNFRVDTDGTLTFPFLGRVPAAGLTLEELQSRLTTLLKAGEILRNPQVRVEVDQYKSRSVFVIGEVRIPGKITMTGTTLTLLEALAQAGSPTANASNQIIVVHPSRPGTTVGGVPGADIEGERITVNRRDLELGRAGREIVLQDGDIINVPVAERFYIYGYVRNPGTYVLDPGMTLQQAIALAGGLADRGSDRRIKAKRLVNGKLTEVALRLEDKILANDTIDIPARFF